MRIPAAMMMPPTLDFEREREFSQSSNNYMKAQDSVFFSFFLFFQQETVNRGDKREKGYSTKHNSSKALEGNRNSSQSRGSEKRPNMIMLSPR